MMDTPDTPPEDVLIRLADVRRLDLRPGDTLAVVIPASSAQALDRVTHMLQHSLGELHPGCHVMVFPEGTDLKVLRDPRIPAGTPDTVLQHIDQVTAPYRQVHAHGEPFSCLEAPQ